MEYIVGFLIVFAIIAGWIYVNTSKALKMILHDLDACHTWNWREMDRGNYDDLIDYDGLFSYDRYLWDVVTLRDPRRNYDERIKKVINA